MNRQATAVSNRLSLRPPQRRSLEILDQVMEVVKPSKATDRAAALAVIQQAFPSVTDFERDFPSLCFALATGVGKTRLMGAFISYLRLAYGLQNFFVLAPNLTIYNKLIADFTPNTPKYVFRGVAEFATEPPTIITGENYDQTLLDQLTSCRVNIFNISKINSEVRGGRSPRIKRLSEYIGESYFEYLANLPDLVLVMDESHRYRASAGVKAINELKPILGLELTATPFTESARGPVPFKNVIYSYPLARAMEDGFVKEPAVVTRRNFVAAGMSAEQIEKLKLEDGVHLHEGLKVELDTYHRETGQPLVKPFVLVIARDTTHATELGNLIASDAFFDGRYKGKVLQVDSSRTGAAEDEMVERLLRVEHRDEPTEIVIHVNMLKEGWDVTNLYTIVPLRAAHARTLVEQSIGRGLRLPFGQRTGISSLDRLNIIAHDRFQEIVDDCNKADSPIRMATVELDDEELTRQTITVTSPPMVLENLGIGAAAAPAPGATAVTPAFADPASRSVAQTVIRAIEALASNVSTMPFASSLTEPAVQALVLDEVKRQLQGQLTLEGTTALDIPAITATTCDAYARGTISIPRVLVTPIGTVTTGFNAFTLDVSSWNYQALTEELWIQHLRTHETEIVKLSTVGIREVRLEDYLVAGLIDFDDVSYDENADTLYELGGQAVRHFRSYLSDDDTRKVLQAYQRPLAINIHAQMHEPGHYWEKVEGYEVEVRSGFTSLKEGAYSVTAGRPIEDFRSPLADKSKIQQVLYGGFVRCLYGNQRFQADTERKLAVILDRDSERWFKPLKEQFHVFYRLGVNQSRYVPDFVVETADAIWMIEGKARNELATPEVLAKKEAAETWCGHASDYTVKHGGKPWKYALVPHDVVDENMSLEFLVRAGVSA